MTQSAFGSSHQVGRPFAVRAWTEPGSADQIDSYVVEDRGIALPSAARVPLLTSLGA
jgi:hypothetical protein